MRNGPASLGAFGYSLFKLANLNFKSQTLHLLIFLLRQPHHSLSPSTVLRMLLSEGCLYLCITHSLHINLSSIPDISELWGKGKCVKCIRFCLGQSHALRCQCFLLNRPLERWAECSRFTLTVTWKSRCVGHPGRTIQLLSPKWLLLDLLLLMLLEVLHTHTQTHFFFTYSHARHLFYFYGFIEFTNITGVKKMENCDNVEWVGVFKQSDSAPGYFTSHLFKSLHFN